MAELSDIVNEVAKGLKVTDIAHASMIVKQEELDFNGAMDSVVKNLQSCNHLNVVYESVKDANPDFVTEVVALQFRYEVVHALRRQLHKKFADSYLGNKEEVELPSDSSSMVATFKKKHFETWTHPWSMQEGDTTDHLGYRYHCSQIETISKDLSAEVRREHKGLLNDINLMFELEIAYANTIYGPVNNGQRDSQKLRTEFAKNIDLYCVKLYRPVA